MNNKLLFATAIIFPCLTTTVQAQTRAEAEAEVHSQSFTAGASIARAQIKSEGEKASFKDPALAGKLSSGYNFNRNLGVQIGAAYLGAASSESEPQKYKERPLSVFGAVTGTIPLSDQFSLTGKIGLTRNDTKITTNFRGVEQSKKYVNTNMMFGVGAEVKISDSISAVMEYENFGKVTKEKDISATGKMISAGLVYRY